MTASEIIPGLYVGTVEDAQDWKGPVLCVLEDDAIRPTDAPLPFHASRIPILVPVAPDDVEVMADLHALTKCVNWIDANYLASLASFQSVLVCCGAGVERSPLTVAWYLYKRQHMNWDHAYNIVLAKRPQAQYRGHWIHDSSMTESTTCKAAFPADLVGGDRSKQSGVVQHETFTTRPNAE